MHMKLLQQDHRLRADYNKSRGRLLMFFSSQTIAFDSAGINPKTFSGSLEASGLT